MMTDINALPPLCVEHIAQQLASLSKDDPLMFVAQEAARLARVSKLFHNTFASPVYDVVDPGCVSEWRNYTAKDTKERYDYLERPLRKIPSGISENSKVKEIQRVCKDFGCKSSGTKPILWANIQMVVQQDIEQRTWANEMALKTVPISIWKCPVREYVRKWIKAQRTEADAQITVTECRKEFWLKDSDLEHIKCTFKRNPHGRSAPPMRLYNKVDVLKLVIKVHGPGELPLTFGEILEDMKNKDKKLKSAHSAYERRHASALCTAKQTGLSDYIANPEVATAINRYANGSSTQDTLTRVLTAINEKQERRKTLQTMLTEQGCELRSDSKLCESYIEHGVGDPHNIVRIMREMKFYYTHTNYKNFLNAAYDNYRSCRYDYYDRPDPEEMSDQAKTKALSDWVKRQPNIKTAYHHADLPPSLKSSVRASSIKQMVTSILDGLDESYGVGEHRSVRDRIIQHVNHTLPIEVLPDGDDDAVRSIVMEKAEENRIINTNKQQLLLEKVRQIIPNVDTSCMFTMRYISQFDVETAQTKIANGSCPFCKKKKLKPRGMQQHLREVHRIGQHGE
jgi:hypothetical protein